jgi:Zn-dependent protease
MQNITVGRLYNLDILITAFWIVCVVVLAIVMALVISLALSVTPAEAILSGIAASAIFWLSELIHQLGHAWAAGRTGYPMTGIRLWGPIGTSLYPSDEPVLPGRTHIRRALGGPMFSLIMSILTGILALALRGAEGGLIGWLALFAFIVNFFVLTLGAFLPLGFTDGSTLLKYWGKA